MRWYGKIKNHVRKHRIPAVWAEPTEEDITRNLENLEKGKNLDMPLADLGKRLKTKWFTCLWCGIPIDGEMNMSGFCRFCYTQLPEIKQYKSKREKLWREQLKVRSGRKNGRL